MNALGQRVLRNRELLAVCVVQVALLWPMLRTPLLFDDSVNSAFTGSSALQGFTFFEHVWNVATSYITDNGRFFPVGVLQGGLTFELLRDHVLPYKVLLLVSVMVSTLCVGALLRRLGASPAVAALVALGASLTFQLRLYHDPIMAYMGLQQLLLAEMALSALCFHIWLRERRVWALVVSLLLLAIGSATYDSGPLLCGLHLVVAIAERRKLVAGFIAALPALLTGAAFLVISSVLRAVVPTIGAGYSASLDVPTAVKTLGVQLTGTLPLSYVGFNPGDRFLYRGDALLGSMGPGSLIAGALAAACAWWVLRNVTREGTGTPWGPALAAGLGIVLLLAPAAPIAIAARYQIELVLGLAYLPVYLQAFGLALLVYAVAVPLAARVPRGHWATALTLVAALGVGGVAALTHRSNTLIADFTQPDRQIRSNAQRGLDAGLLADAERNAVMFSNAPTPGWYTPSFMYMHAKRVFSSSSTLPPRDQWPADGPSPWYTVFSPEFLLAGPLRPDAGRTRLFLPGRERPATWIVLSDGTTAQAGIRTGGTEDEVVTLPPGTDPASVVMLPLPAGGDAPFIQPFAGCGNPEGPAPGHSWCLQRGALGVVNPSGAERRVVLRFGVRTAGPERARVRIETPGGTRTVRTGASVAPVELPLTLPARSGQVVRLQTDADPVPNDPRGLYMAVEGAVLG